MKKGFLIAGLFISAISFGQPAIKLYGFSQTHLPGTVRERDRTDSVNKKKLNIDYYLFLAFNASNRIQPNQVWIQGQQYTVNSATPVKTPFYAAGSHLLVPRTTLKVVQLDWNKSLAGQRSQASWLKKLIKENEWVVSYTWKGKKYYKALKKIKRLEPVLGE